VDTKTKQESNSKLRQEDADRRQAELAAEQAAKDADDAKAKLDVEVKNLEELDKKLGDAISAVSDAKNEKAREAAKAKLDALKKEHDDQRARVEQMKAASAKAERLRGTKIKKECLDNPLAAGCE
jgi:hypothetical protein